MRGRSLRPLVENPGIGSTHRSVPIESEFGRAVVSDGFKYVLYDEGVHREQLYDLRADPGETRNAARDDAGRDTLARMREEFGRHFGGQLREPGRSGC